MDSQTYHTIIKNSFMKLSSRSICALFRKLRANPKFLLIGDIPLMAAIVREARCCQKVTKHKLQRVCTESKEYYEMNRAEREQLLGWFRGLTRV